MARFERIGRRAFLTEVGRSSLGIVVFGTALTACASQTDGESGGGEPDGGAADGGEPVDEPTETDDSPDDVAAETEPAAWARVDLGFVAAYVVVRGGEATVVDTGTSGSAGAILESLEGLGLGWGAVGHVVLTHNHPDHIGSASAVADAAADATFYAGAGDITSLSVPNETVVVGDDSIVMGLEVVETPGHTPGSISVYDRAGGLMVVGDALNVDGEDVTGPNAQFTADMEEAWASVAKLAGFDFEALGVGHGGALTTGAGAKVKALAAANA